MTMLPEHVQYANIRMYISQQKSSDYTDDAARKILALYDDLIKKKFEKGKTYTESEFRTEVIRSIAKSLQTKTAIDFASVAMQAASDINSIMSYDGRVATYNAVNLTANKLQGIAMASKYQGRFFKTAHEQDMLAQLDSRLRKMMLEGNDPKSMTRKALNEMYAKELRTPELRRKIESISRTYTMQAGSYARDIAYKQNADLIVGFQYVATLELTRKGSRTCARCGSRDGTIYKKNESRPFLPLHYNCRCVYAAITKSWADLGLDIPEMQTDLRKYKEKIDNTVVQRALVTNQNFSDIYENASEKRKIGIVGKTRFKMLEKGLIEFDELSDKRRGDLIPIKILGKKIEKKYNKTIDELLD